MENSAVPMHSNGGYWMLIGLVVLLLAPVGITHMVRSMQAPAPTQHAALNH